LYNAGKYTLASTVWLFGVFNPFYNGGHKSAPQGQVIAFQVTWVVLFLSSTMYSCEYEVMVVVVVNEYMQTD